MPRKTLDEIAAEIEAAKAAGMIWNVDYQDLKQAAQRTYEDEKKAVFKNVFGAVAYLDKPENVRKCYDAIPFEMRYCAGRKMPGAEYADSCIINALVARWAPIAEGIKALKPLAIKGRKVIPVTPEKEAEIAADAAARRTCQICGRKILPDADGKLALHGYQRPGDGQQTASCYGARELKFEADCTVLGRYIETVLKSMRTTTEQAAAFWAIYTGPIFKRTSEFTGRTVVAIKGGEGWKECEAGGYEAKRMIEIERYTAERDLKFIERDIADQQKRFDTWTKMED